MAGRARRGGGRAGVRRAAGGGGGTLVRMEGGVVAEVEGDPSNPINRGKLCAKAGVSSIEQLYHPDRLNHPLIRVGKRGEGKWRRATWDEALSEIAQKMNGLKQQCGAESVAFARGVGMNNQHIIGRVARSLG